MLTEHGCCLCLCLLYGGFEDEVQLAIVEVTGRLAFELAVVAEGLVEGSCNGGDLQQ